MCLGGASVFVPVSLSPQEANQFLSRHKRANQVFEETKQGHLERECVEERCTKEEAREVFENDPETVSMCWAKVVLSSLKSRAHAVSSLRHQTQHYTTPPSPHSPPSPKKNIKNEYN